MGRQLVLHVICGTLPDCSFRTCMNIILKKSKWYFLSQIMPAKHKAWIKVTFMYTKCLQSSWRAPCVIVSQHCILTCREGENSCSFYSQLLFFLLYRYIYFHHFYASTYPHAQIYEHRSAYICTFADRCQ